MAAELVDRVVALRRLMRRKCFEACRGTYRWCKLASAGTRVLPLLNGDGAGGSHTHKG